MVVARVHLTQSSAGRLASGGSQPLMRTLRLADPTRRLGLAASVLLLTLGLGCVPRVRPNEGFIPVEGGRIWYHRVGPNAGTPLVLLHGGREAAAILSSHCSLSPPIGRSSATTSSGVASPIDRPTQRCSRSSASFVSYRPCAIRWVLARSIFSGNRGAQCSRRRTWAPTQRG